MEVDAFQSSWNCCNLFQSIYEQYTVDLCIHSFTSENNSHSDDNLIDKLKASLRKL